jgi:hypothetical protein
MLLEATFVSSKSAARILGITCKLRLSNFAGIQKYEVRFKDFFWSKIILGQYFLWSVWKFD